MRLSLQSQHHTFVTYFWVFQMSVKSACVWPTALKLGCVTNFDMLFRTMGIVCLNLLSRHRCSTKVSWNTRIKHTTGKSKPGEISKWTNCQSHTPKYRKAPSFCFNFYKVMYGERASLARSVHLSLQNLIKTTIFKLMALRDTLVSDSEENWSTF